MSRDGQPRVALFFWEGYLSVQPSLWNAACLLSSEGLRVDIFLRTPDNDFAPLPALPEGVRVFECRPRSFRYRPVEPPVNDGDEPRDPPPMDSGLQQRLLLLDFLQFLGFALRHVLGHRYAAFIGVDVHGLNAASLAALVMRVPVIYWSLELTFLRDFTEPFDRFAKKLERFFSRRARMVIIQHTYRARSLAEENGFSLDRVVLVPNAPIGTLPLARSRFFHDRFGLPADRQVVLQLGMIAVPVFTFELAQQVPRWPEPYVLVLHDRMRHDPEHHSIRWLREAGQGRVFVSVDPVPFDALDDLVRSAAIGLVLYRADAGDNFALIAGASGKLAYYLRCGVPVICLDLPGLRELVEGYACGICVQTLDEIGPALEKITADHERYRANALRCFEERFEFRRHFEPVLQAIRCGFRR